MTLSASQSLRHQGLVRRAAVYQAWVDAQCMRLTDALAMLRADAQQANVDFEPSDFVCASTTAARSRARRPAPAAQGAGFGILQAA